MRTDKTVMEERTKELVKEVQERRQWDTSDIAGHFQMSVPGVRNWISRIPTLVIMTTANGRRSYVTTKEDPVLVSVDDKTTRIKTQSANDIPHPDPDKWQDWFIAGLEATGPYEGKTYVHAWEFETCVQALKEACGMTYKVATCVRAIMSRLRVRESGPRYVFETWIGVDKETSHLFIVEVQNLSDVPRCVKTHMDKTIAEPLV